MSEKNNVSSAVAKARAELSKEKSGAVWLAMMDIYEYINISAIAKNDFGKSANWLLQRVHGYCVNGKPAKLKESEISILSSSLRRLGEKLIQAADRIEKAGPDTAE